MLCVQANKVFPYHHGAVSAQYAPDKSASENASLVYVLV